MRINAFAIPMLLVSAVVLCASSRPRRKHEVHIPHFDGFLYQPAAKLNEDLIPTSPFKTPPDTITIRMIGDVMMHTAQIGRDYTSFLSGIEDDLRSADLAIANMEFALGGEPYSGYPAFSAPDSYAEYVHDIGVDVFLTANNHILDKGKRGLNRTLDVYDSMKGVLHTGTGKDDLHFYRHNPLIIRVNGVKVGIVNATYGTNADQAEGYPVVFNFGDMKEPCEAVRRARKAGAKLVIALPHWGNEYELTHSWYQVGQARALAEAGADIIVGAHPHVVQDMTTISVTEEDGTERKVPVIYSMGNAVSNMSARNTQVELMVTLKVIRYEDDSIRMLDPTWDWLWCSRPGNLCDNYKTIKIDDYVGRRDEWISPWDYDNMISSRENVRKETGIR